jgi:hypothetical protein
VWARTFEGQPLKFHLAGIHNQNFIMRDEQTGSFWQQVSGRCISGPLKGAQLQRVHSDEVSLAMFAAEAPGGSVLLGDPAYAQHYEADWEQQIAGLPTVVDTSDTALPPRELIAGVEAGGAARAYLPAALTATPLLLDELGGVPLLLWSTGPRALRAFDRRIDGTALLLAPAGANRVVDSDTGSIYDPRGCAIEGPRAGKCMPPVVVLWDYWFDWHGYHPDTGVHGR